MSDLAPAVGPPRGRRARAPASPADERVFRAVYDAILDHRLPPGTKLTEETLAEIFGVGRAVIRKALLRLAYDDVVEIRPNRGAQVAQPTPEEARDVFEARRLIEAAIVAKAASVVTADDLAALRAIVADESAAARGGDRRAALRLSGAFHLRLAAIAGNAIYEGFLRRLVSRTSLILALYELPSTGACAADEHLGLADALARGDRDGAAALMDRHLRDLERRIDLDGNGRAVDLREVLAAGPGHP